MVRLGDPDTVIRMTLSLQAHDLKRSGRMDTDRRPSSDARDLLDIATQERVSRARVGGESNAVVNGLTIKESELFVPHPVSLIIDGIVATDENLAQFIEIDPTSSGWNDSANLVAPVAHRELVTEDFRVAEEALLLIDGVAIAVLVRIYNIFTQQTEQDCHGLVNVVYCPAVGIVERDEDFEDSRWSVQHILGNPGRLDESIDEVPGQPEDRF